jgi:hypothetical protein
LCFFARAAAPLPIRQRRWQKPDKKIFMAGGFFSMVVVAGVIPAGKAAIHARSPVGFRR